MDNIYMEKEMIKTVHRIKRMIDEKISLTIGKELTVPQAHLIGYIYNADKDIYQKDIEEEFDLQRSSVSLMLSNMEKQGLIIRCSVNSDARLKKIELTDKAKSLQNRIFDSIQEVHNKLRYNISDKEFQSFMTTLKKIRNNTK